MTRTLMGGVKIGNEYARMLERDYARTPKAVLAAIAVSFAIHLQDEEDLSKARGQVMAEWAALHAAGIVPQAPPETGGA